MTGVSAEFKKKIALNNSFDFTNNTLWELWSEFWSYIENLVFSQMPLKKIELHGGVSTMQ